ncbi:unnamed protein product [Pylaiella littoralis]
MTSDQDVSSFSCNAAKERANRHPNKSSATSAVAATMFEVNLYKRRRHLLGTVGVLACVVLLVLVTNFRWSRMHHPARATHGITGGSSFGIRGGGDGGAAAGSKLVHHEPQAFVTSAVANEVGSSGNGAAGNRRTSVELELGAAATPWDSTVLLVALGDGLEGKSALQVWSDFVQFAQTPVTAATMINQGNFDRDCGGGSGGSVITGSWLGPDSHANGDGGDASQSLFPPVWIFTSDPGVDKTIRESMPHLRSFFVSGALDDEDSGDVHPKGQETISWSDVLDRFLSENPGVDVFGIYGEGAMPTAALLPYFLVSDSATSDAASATAVATAGCSGRGSSSVGGCAIESVLWPVLSKAIPPTAVISRARAWWMDDRVTESADGEPCRRRGIIGDWMPDRFVAQVWCNRAMLTTTSRKATGLGEPGSIVGKGLDSFLHVIQRLLREPGAVNAVLVDGTKAVPSRYLHPPAAAENSGDAVEKEQDEGGHVMLRQLVHVRREKEKQRQHKHPGDPVDASKSAFSSLTATTRESFPEVEFYIGTLELALSFGAANLSANTLKAATASNGAGFTTSSSSGGAGVSDKSWDIVKAPWPPEYILETVVQSQFAPAGFGFGGGDTGSEKQQGLVIVSSVNCGYIDMAVNFLLSLRRSAIKVKVLFVATDEVSFDVLDALSPGHTALFAPKSWSRNATGAGSFRDDIFKAQTCIRPTILISILEQGYRTLWTDSDTVWLGSVFPVLPDPRDKTNPVAEVVLVADGVEVANGLPRNTCTCFMYFDLTPNAIRLAQLWAQNIVDIDAPDDQSGFQGPLREMRDNGLRLDILPGEVMPTGKFIFNEERVEEHYELYRANLLVVHNNYIKGHDAKLGRFRAAGLWEVEGTVFPTCDR